MSLLTACISCAALFALLRFGILLFAKSAWSRSQLSLKIPRLMLVGVLEKLTQLSGIACVTFGALSLFVFFASAGSASTSESALHLLLRVQRLEHPVKQIEEWYKAWIFLCSLLIFAFLWYQAARRFALKKLEDVRLGEYKRLAELRDRSPETWPQLPPTSQMNEIDAEVQSLLALAQSLYVQDGPKQRITALIEEAKHLAQVRTILDFDRRIELPWDIPDLEDHPPQSAIVRFFSSKGFLSDMNLLGKLLSGTCTVLLFIATAGASIPGIDRAFQDRLAHLRDIEIDLDDKESHHNLAQAESNEVPPAPAPQNQDSGRSNSAAVQKLSWQIARSFSSGQQFVHLSNDLQGEIVRTEILEKTGVIHGDVPQANSVGEHLLNGLTDHDGSGGALAKNIAAQITQDEAAHPALEREILAWAARHNETPEPAELSDYMAGKVGDAFFDSLPTGDSPFGKEVFDQLSDPLKEQAGKALKATLNRVYASLLSAHDPEAELAQITDRHLLDPRAQIEA